MVGVASYIITEKILEEHPVVVRGVSGPRLRVYCVYDDDALDEDKLNEEPLTWSPTADDGSWRVALPVVSGKADVITGLIPEEINHFILYSTDEGVKLKETQPPEQLTIDRERWRKL